MEFMGAIHTATVKIKGGICMTLPFLRSSIQRKILTDQDFIYNAYDALNKYLDKERSKQISERYDLPFISNNEVIDLDQILIAFKIAECQIVKDIEIIKKIKEEKGVII